MKTLIAFTCVAIVGLFIAADYAFSLPDVLMSYDSGHCVEVVNYADGDNYSCGNMPSKFNHIWTN